MENASPPNINVGFPTLQNQMIASTGRLTSSRCAGTQFAPARPCGERRAHGDHPVAIPQCIPRQLRFAGVDICVLGLEIKDMEVVLWRYLN
jgi:hypothetical protein